MPAFAEDLAQAVSEGVKPLPSWGPRTVLERDGVVTGCVAVNASDLVPALIALGASIQTSKRSIAAEEFFAALPMCTSVLDPDELVARITIPSPQPGSRLGFHKFRIKNAIDFPIVSVASVFALGNGTIKTARIALGAVAPVPRRARQVEEFLAGKEPKEQTAEVAGYTVARGVYPLEQNAYKFHILRALIRQAIFAVE